MIDLSDFITPLGIVVAAFGGVGWMTVLRVHPRRESAWVIEVRFPAGPSRVEACAR